jgi:hypothetical protein
MFGRTFEITGASNVNPMRIVPKFCAIVTIALGSFVYIGLVRHRREVWLCHDVQMQLVFASLAVCEKCRAPKLRPDRLKKDPPVIAPLCARNAESTGAS